MAKTKISEETTVSSRDLPAELKALLIKKAHSIYEREPHAAFVGQHLDSLVTEIINLF